MGSTSAARHRIAPVVLAVVTFVGVAAGLRSLVPLPEDSNLRGRFEELAREHDRIDILFLGPSTTRCSFDPVVVDEELGRLGHPVRSFNLGLRGASLLEIDYLLERALALDLSSLDWVVIELQYTPPSHLVRPGNRFTERAVYWHDLDRVQGVFRSLRHAPSAIADGPAVALLHVRHALWRAFSLGRAEAMFSARFGDASDGTAAQRAATTRGYAPEDCIAPEQQRAARQRFLARPEEYRRKLGRVDRLNARATTFDHFDVDRLERQVERIRAAGAEPLYVVTPTILHTPAVRALREAGVLPALLLFNSPARYPELYAIESRQDAVHLAASATDRFGRIFARAFDRWLETGREIH
jgi:hypothetical protein